MDIPNKEGPLPGLSSLELLRMTDKQAPSYKYDIAVAQDALKKRVTAANLKDVVFYYPDSSKRGDSISSWIHRVGGAEATLSVMHNIVKIRNPAKAQLAKIARNMIPEHGWVDNAYNSEDLEFLREVLIAAIQRGKRNVVDAIEQRLPSLRTSYLALGDFNHMCISDLGSILNQYRKGENPPPQKPVFEINDLQEVRKEFEKEAAKYVDVGVALEQDYSWETKRPFPMDDRAFWLVMRIGELKDVDYLKKILDNDDAGITHKKEAVRQLAVAGQEQFLKGFVYVNSVVPSTKSKNPFDRLENEVETSLPAYVEAIVGTQV